VPTVRAFLPLVRADAVWRRIVLTASVNVLSPSVRLGAYQASRFAVTGFGETLREELASEGIGVAVLFPGGMLTRHLESSALARPEGLGDPGAADDDIEAMMAHRPLAEGDLLMAEEAIRHLLAELRDDRPYVVTHGSFRPWYERRRDAMEAALDRMEEP
jgi:NAD(P)-dependent dehydrogenase (short-subunit alcohol dehydrogenase family)